MEVEGEGASGFSVYLGEDLALILEREAAQLFDFEGGEPGIGAAQAELSEGHPCGEGQMRGRGEELDQQVRMVEAGGGGESAEEAAKIGNSGGHDRDG